MKIKSFDEKKNTERKIWKHENGGISTFQKFIDKAFWQAKDNRWMMGEYASILQCRFISLFPNDHN